MPIKLLSSILFILFPAYLSTGCGFFILNEEYRFWAFDPNLGKAQGLTPFFYSSNVYSTTKTSDFGYPEIDISNESEQNISEWYLKLNRNASRADIRTVLYSYSPIEFFESYENSKKQNSFLNETDSKPELKSYLEFAKKIEQVCNFSDPWECADCPEITKDGIKRVENSFSYYSEANEVKMDAKQGQKLIESGKQLLNKSKDIFVRKRIVFQLIKLNHYLNEPSQAEKLYQTYFATSKEENWLKYSALFYTLYYFEDAQNNYKLSKVFEYCPEKRFRSIQLMDFSKLDQTLKFVHSKKEAATLLVMSSIQKPGPMLDKIAVLVQLDPESKFLPLLLVREINKLEDWVLGPQTTNLGSTRDGWFSSKEEKMITQQKNRVTDLAYAYKVQNLVEGCLKNKSTKYAPLLHLCAGYIAFIRKDLVQAEEHYSQVNGVNLPAIQTAQLHLCKVMLELSKSSSVSPELEDRLMNCITFLEQSNVDFLNKNELKDQLILFAANEFCRRGELAKGLLLFGKTGRAFDEHPVAGYANVYTKIHDMAGIKEYNEILSIFDKPVKTPFETFITDTVMNTSFRFTPATSAFNKNIILDLKSMYLVRKDQLSEAFKTVLQIDTAYWNQEPNSLFLKDNPFIVDPWNGHASMNEKNLVNTKVTFLRKLLELKVSMAKAKGDKKAWYCYQIGNAYFSMTYSGKYWIMQRNYWTSSETNTDVKSFDKIYFQGIRARYYYKKALQLTTNEQLANISSFMLYQCFLNESNEAQLKAIQAKKMKPDYYQQLQSNCLLFYDFVKTYF